MYIPPGFTDLLEALRGSSAITVLVNDPQRGTATRTALEALVKRLSPGSIRILVATGTHRFSPEQQDRFAKSLVDGLGISTVAWHDATGENLVSVAGVYRGHPWLLEEPELLAIGSVEPHYFAGFTGAHKTCTIGCAAYDDIVANHSLALDSRCAPCVREGNPVYEGITAMARALMQQRTVHAINYVQDGERITAVSAGDPLTALDDTANTVINEMGYALSTAAPVVVATVTGPLGVNFYQADKGIKNNESAVANGGVFVLEAPCPEGLGPSHFTDLLAAAPDYAHATAVVACDGYRLGDHKAVRLRHLTDPACRNVRLLLVSEHLTDADAALLGMTRFPHVQAALASEGIDPADPQILHIADAANRFPRPRD